MNLKTISIIGGYGATGLVVAKKLASHTKNTIHIVGRDLVKAEKLVREIGNNAKAIQADIFDETQLVKVCQVSDIIVNCAGPSVKIKDKIARVAMRENCDYIDAGGYEFTYEMLKNENNYLKENKLCCVLSAGWIPGIAEVLANYADSLANAIFDKKESMVVYYGDRNDWSDAGLLDTIQYIKNNSLSGMAIIEKGNLKKQFGLNFSKTFDLPFEVGKQRGFLHLIPELKPFALRNQEYENIKSYLVLFGWQTFLAMMKIKFLLNLETQCIKTLKQAYCREVESKGKMGVSIAEIIGLNEGKRQKLQLGIINRGGYDLTGIGCAATVMLLLNKNIRPGVKYLPDAVNAIDFMEILSNWGIKIFESII